MAKIKTKEQLLKLQEKYKTDTKIGEQFGITRQAVHQSRILFGIPSIRYKNVERDEKIIKAYRKGVPGTSIAPVHGLSISQTYRIITKMK